MKRLMGLWIVGWAAAALWPACLPLEPGRRMSGTGNRDYPACYSVRVEGGGASQIVVEQADDLAIEASSDAGEVVADSFDFGAETLTIDEPGSYRIRVRRVGTAAGTFRFVIYRKPLSIEAARDWRRAEEWATLSKRSGKADDLAESLRLWREMNIPAAIARTYLKQGDSLSLRDTAQARLAYEQALELCRAESDLRCAAEAANNSGYAAQRSGDFDGALKRLSEAADLWGRLSNRTYESVSWSNIGLLYQRQGAFADAIRVLERAGRALRPQDALERARVVNTIGACYLQLEEFGKARLCFQSALAAAERAGSMRDTARFRLNLGHTYLLEGNPREARIVLAKAREEAEQQPERELRANVLNNLGQCSLALGDLTTAQANFAAALAIHRDAGDKRGQAYDLHYLGTAAKTAGQMDTARDYLEQAARIRRDGGLRNDLSLSLFELAQLEGETNRPDRARSLTEEALKLLESVRVQVPGPSLRASFYSRKRRFFDLLVELDMAGSEPDPAAGLLAVERGRGRAMLDLLAEGSLLRQLPAPLLAERNTVQRSIDSLSVQLLGAKPEQETVLRSRLDQLLERDDAIEAEVRGTVKDLPIGRPLASVADLQREGLPADSALLEFQLGESRSYLWLVERSQVRVFLLPPRSALEKLGQPVVGNFGKILERRRSPQLERQFRRSLRQLSDALLGPLGRAKLPRRLILALDGVLLRVPFASLTLPAEGSPMGLLHDLVQTPSAAYLLAGRKPRLPGSFPKSILALCDPVFSAADGRFNGSNGPRPANHRAALERLPFQEDVEAIRKLVPEARRDVLSGFAVNPSDLGRLRLADYGVLHFSTHALIDDRQPEVSRIALSLIDRAGRPVDGYLRPYQLARWRLDGSVVVLSACETALGKQVSGEGLSGFSSSLFYAGAGQLVLAMDKVDAEASAEFFAETYRHYLSSPMPMERALTLARRTFAASKEWNDPYYWAPFIVVGRPQ